MPIIVTPGSGVSAPTAPGPPVYPQRSPAHWTWCGPCGATVEITRTGDTIFLEPGAIAGHMSPPVDLIESAPPSMDGAIYRGNRVQPRDLSIVISVVADTTDDWYQAIDLLAQVFDTSTADGVLCSRRPDGVTRMLRARYVAGMESPDGGDPAFALAGRFPIQLRAHDPWWYGPVVSLPWQFPTPQDFIPASGAPPFYISPVRVGGAITEVTNPGDVPAFPVWTLTGPLTAVTLTEHVSARSLTVTAPLAAGEQITVDTDPRVPAPSKITQGGVSVWGVLTGDYPDLWPLPAGETGVSVTVTGSTDTTRVLMQFNPRFRTA